MADYCIHLADEMKTNDVLAIDSCWVLHGGCRPLLWIEALYTCTVCWNKHVLSRFEWDASKFAPDFTISPTEGYIAQGMDVQFNITFRPRQINSAIRYDVRIAQWLLTLWTLLGHSGSVVRCMNKVTLHWARLVPGWVTIFGWVYRIGM